ncbi:hypothetical protein BCBD1442_19500 [Brucella ceti]|nr:hypothetical protein BCBD1442_19500 [Brucella ceti]
MNKKGAALAPFSFGIGRKPATTAKTKPTQDHEASARGRGEGKQAISGHVAHEKITAKQGEPDDQNRAADPYHTADGADERQEKQSRRVGQKERGDRAKMAFAHMGCSGVGCYAQRTAQSGECAEQDAAWLAVD